MTTKILKPAALMLFFALTSISCLAQSSSILDGRTFWITSYDENGKENQEYLIFESEEVKGSQCIKYGFQPGNYEVNGTGFKTLMKAKGGGEMNWIGQVNNKTIAGTVIWKDEKGAIVKYTFDGYETKNKSTKKKL